MRERFGNVACVLLVAILLTTTVTHGIAAEGGQAELRVRLWSSKAGTYLRAKLARLEGESVVLLKEEGGELSVPLTQLSNVDQEYVKKQVDGGQIAKVALPTASGGAASELLEKCKQLSQELTNAYRGANAGAKPTIAVVEFSDLAGGVTNDGRLISEEMTTAFVSTGKFKVVERLLLNKVIAEHKLQLQGIIDPKSAQELGKILGVDTIVSGTIADVSGSLRVNARLISTKDGEVFAAAAVTVSNATQDRTGGSGGTKGNVQFPYREDFSKYEDDAQNTDWGRNGRVKTGADGRKWLIPSANGPKTIGLDVDLPQDAYIEFDYDFRLLEAGGQVHPGQGLSGICLVDEAGARYRIEWTIDMDTSANIVFHHHLKLPGGAETTASFYFSPLIVRNVDSQHGTVKIRKTGDTITVLLEGKSPSGTAGRLAGSVSDFKKFRRFEVELYKGKNATLSFTNFQIGNPQ